MLAAIALKNMMQGTNLPPDLWSSEIHTLLTMRQHLHCLGPRVRAAHIKNSG